MTSAALLSIYITVFWRRKSFIRRRVRRMKKKSDK